MEQEKSNEIREMMADIYTKTAEKEDKNTAISNITYYKNFAFDSAGFIENDIFITKLEKNTDKGKTTIYEIHNRDGELIATVDENGKIQFKPEYIEKLKEEYEKYFELLKLDTAVLELPKEMKEQDIGLVPEELDKIAKSKEEKKNKENKEEEKEEEKEQDEIEPKEEEKEIARKKGIPVNNVLVVRENSNLYKDHPEVEKGLIFSKDKDGVIKAEYIDENGELQPSKYIMPSSTAVRQETISMGNDGKPVTRETPYQVMQTRNLTGRDQDIRDIRINVKIDTYGYLDIEEARQGRNGEWEAHDIEVRGRNYNSEQLNEATSIRTGMADPDNETKSYNKTESTELVQDGIQYDEMYLMQHADEIIEGFIKEGYQKNEAIQIFDYMIGEETLTEEEAKERVNETIQEKEEKSKEAEQELEESEERTPWGDAEERRKR